MDQILRFDLLKFLESSTGGGDSSGGCREGGGVALSECPNSFNFLQFWRKFLKIVCWRPLDPPLDRVPPGRWWLGYPPE